MAVLVAIGGAALGSAIGIGPSVGWIVGSVVGNLLFPSGEDTRIEGPRLGDLAVSSSAYGQFIPITYGTLRMGGNVIWSEPIEEVKRKKKRRVGKGGGASQTTVTYEYYCTFAIAFCEGPVDDILRIWADGKLIYDKTGLDDDVSKVGVDFRFYPGSENQEPDSLIEADRGEGSVPAFRGLCYIVFDRLPLKDFGNRLPNITAEVTLGRLDPRPVTDFDFYTAGEGGVASSFDNTSILPDFTRSVLYTCQTSATQGDNYLRRGSTRTMVEDRQKQLSTDQEGNPVEYLEIHAVMPNGKLIVQNDNTDQAPISLVNPDNMALHDTFGVADNSSPEMTSTDFLRLTNGRSSWVRVGGPAGTEYYALCICDSEHVGLLRTDRNLLEYVWDTLNCPEEQIDIDEDIYAPDQVLGSCAGAEGDNFGEAYLIAGPDYSSASSDGLSLYKLTVNAGSSYDSTSGAYNGVRVDIVVTHDPDDLIPGETDIRDFRGPVYDATDDTVMIQVQADSDGQAYMLKLNPVDGEILWRVAVPALHGSGIGMNHSRIDGGVYGQMDGNSAWAVYTTTGDLFYSVSGWSLTQDATGSSWWDGRVAVVVGAHDGGGIGKWLFFRGNGDGSTLDGVVSDLCSRAGIDASDIDVTDLASVQVDGYTIGRSISARAAIEELARLYFFDGVESDDILVFSFRAGKSSVATITQDDMATINQESGDFLRENRVQEVELPGRFTLTYMAKDNAYQQAAHSAKRVGAPSPAMYSKNEVGRSFAVALSAEQAKQQAEKMLFSAWVERTSLQLATDWSFLALDPADVVTVQLDDGTEYRTRVASIDVGADLALDMTAINEIPQQYTSTVEADGGDSGITQGFLSQTLTKLILLQSPLLRDTDDVGRTSSVLYYFMGGYGQSGWTAATLYKSSEGTEYGVVGAVTEEASWGTAANALADTDTPFQTDEVNTLTVYMNTGASNLSSATQLEMLNGANAGALIRADGEPEIIQFRNVTVNSDGSRTLSGLLRGRRGTEVFTSGHQVGDVFVLLDGDTGDVVPLTLGEKDSTIYYVGVTVGQLFEDAPVNTKASPHNDLKPYAPVHVQAVQDGADIDLSWVRRTRIGGQMQSGTGTVPLNEDEEAYEVDILDGPGGSVVRTVDALTSPEYTYTAAQQSADGFSSPTELTLSVYQISAQVGRGFSKEVTVNVQ